MVNVDIHGSEALPRLALHTDLVVRLKLDPKKKMK